MRIRKAVLPVAGLGTRVLPASKVIPKEMLPLVDKPTLQYIVEEAVAAGIEEIIFVTSRSKRSTQRQAQRIRGTAPVTDDGNLYIGTTVGTAWSGTCCFMRKRIGGR